MMGRKGDWTADTMPFMIIFIFVATFLTFGFILITQRFVADNYTIPDGVENFVIQRRFFSSTCFGAENILSGRADHFIIDSAKFNQQTMDRCYIFDNHEKFFAYELTLRVGDNTPLTLKTSNWGDRFAKQSERDVRVWKDGAIMPGKLTMEVQHADE